MKKIIFIISTLNTGGAQKVLSNLVMGLPDGYEPVILLNDAENIVYPYKGKLVSLGFRGRDNKLNLLYQLRVMLKRIQALRGMKRSGEYIAAVSFLDSANIANILSGRGGRRGKCRTILSVHNTLSESTSYWGYRYLVNPLIRYLYRRADCVIAVSKGIAYDLINRLGLPDRNMAIVYNGHDIAKIRMAAQEPPAGDEEPYFHMAAQEQPAGDEESGFRARPVIATMGRMNYQKAQWHLIRALIEVRKQFSEIRLLILGDGELRPYLERLIRECGVEENVTLCGFLQNPFAILAKCDAFVFPSMFEGFPNALIEALCCSLPCIAADFRSGAREILAPALPIEGQITDEILSAEYGILTPVCDGTQYDGATPLTKEERLLAEAIIRLLRDDTLRQSYIDKSAQAAARFGVERMVEKWLEVIEE